MSIIAVDFDGTCVASAFPKVGHDIGAAPVLKELRAKGHQLILWTVRANVANPTSDNPDIITTEGGDFLDDAVGWFMDNHIILFGVNENYCQKSWSSSPKCYADYYIDDRAIGVPLTKERHVDWSKMRYLLQMEGLL